MAFHQRASNCCHTVLAMLIDKRLIIRVGQVPGAAGSLPFHTRAASIGAR